MNILHTVDMLAVYSRIENYSLVLSHLTVIHLLILLFVEVSSNSARFYLLLFSGKQQDGITQSIRSAARHIVTLSAPAAARA